MGVMKRAILSVWRKKTKTLLFLITVIVISCFEFGINSTKNAQIAIQNSVQAAAQRSFRIEVNLTDYRQRLMDIPVTRLPNGATLSKMPNNQFGSVLMEDIQSIAQVEGIQFYNITTAPFAVNPYNFKRIEDIESDQYEDQQAVTLIGNLKMNQDREILNGTLKLKEGRWGDENDSNVCVISDEIAKMNELNIGDELQFNDYKDRENSSVCSMRIYLLINVVIRNMSIGQLSLHINSIDNFRNSIITILNTMASIYEDGLYVNNLFEFLEIKNNIMRENQKYIQEISKVEFRHVWFKYPNTEKYILEDINFVIEKGKSYSFVGLNGSGKTTIIKLILNLYNPTRGEILVNDINLSNIDMEEYLSKIGVVFQDFMKYPLTISENISIASVRQMNNKNKIEKAAKLSGADQFINKLPKKYDTSLFREWEDGVQLSIGQWQKIAISRAFLEDFPVIILDEPTASLDAYAEFELYKKFKDIVKNKTSILIAHRFSTIKLADLIYVIKNGKIIESGSHNELMKLNGEYAYLYRIQSDAYVSK